MATFIISGMTQNASASITRYSAITRKSGPPNLVLEAYLEELNRLISGISKAP